MDVLRAAFVSKERAGAVIEATARPAFFSSPRRGALTTGTASSTATGGGLAGPLATATHGSFLTMDGTKEVVVETFATNATSRAKNPTTRPFSSVSFSEGFISVRPAPLIAAAEALTEAENSEGADDAGALFAPVLANAPARNSPISSTEGPTADHVCSVATRLSPLVRWSGGTNPGRRAFTNGYFTADVFATRRATTKERAILETLWRLSGTFIDGDLSSIASNRGENRDLFVSAGTFNSTTKGAISEALINQENDDKS